MQGPLEQHLAETLTRLRTYSDTLEERGEWPASSWKSLRDAGVLRWFIPEEFGGAPVPEWTRQLGYLLLASACLTTTFILTQRNAAVSRILLSGNESLKRDLLTAIADDRLFVTVGISHLTTSRQHLKQPAVLAAPTDGGWIVSGEVPWVTSAARAGVIVTGGVQPDGLQVLVALETSAAGVEIQSPPRLLALNESETATVALRDVFVPEAQVLLGPAATVLKSGGAGGITTSALALGAARRSIDALATEAVRRPNLSEIVDNLCRQLMFLRGEVEEIVQLEQVGAVDETTAANLERLRRQSNALVLNSAQSYLTASKGAGFLAAHPASRAVREAQFFQVWSCPQAVMQAALEAFSCAAE